MEETYTIRVLHHSGIVIDYTATASSEEIALLRTWEALENHPDKVEGMTVIHEDQPEKGLDA